MIPKIPSYHYMLFYSPPELNLLVMNFIFCIHVKYPLPPGDNPIAVDKYYYYYYYYY